MPSSIPTIFSRFLSLFLLLISLTAAQEINSTLIDGPLFERYQFLSPGIMMGFLTLVILGSILFVGVSAISSLEVTYAAFEKESGPGSTKK